MSITKKIKSRPLTAIFSLIVMCMLGFSLGLPVDADKPEKTKVGALGERGGGELAVCPVPVVDQAAYAAKSASVASFSAPLEDAFLLHSNPGATQILYIDFDGYEAGWATLTSFNMDGDPNTFNDEERQVIIDTWFACSEDFLPYNIDVTTEEPPNGFLGQRAVVDGSNLYTYSWAYVGAWADTNGEIAYCYHGDDTWQWIENSVSHEVGHTLGLHHDGRGSQGYYTGHGTGDTQWCPIMGWGADSINVWSNGDYNGADNQQDDLTIISNVSGVDYRPDDHGSDTGSATAIALSSTLELVAEGIIEQNDDLDFFSFTTTGGDVSISINEDVIINATNLDVEAKLYNSGGSVIATSNPVDRLWATFDENLASGTYYISVDGVGMGDPTTNPPSGYSDYAILGYFSIYASETIVGDPVPDVVGLTEAAATTAINNDGFSTAVTTSYHPTVAAGLVISQNPSAGTNAAAGSTVTIDVSLGILIVNVPNVVTLTEGAAIAAINVDFVVGTVTQSYSASIPAGIVISQSPVGGTPAAAGSAVDYEVSLGVQPVTVPNVVDSDLTAATTAINGASLNVGSVSNDYSNVIVAGNVVSQSPVGGSQAAPGSNVDLVISDGPSPVLDVVTITKAEYKSDKDEFKVEATSSDGNAVTLTLVGFGDMTWKNNKFEYKVKPLGTLPPCDVTVVSSHNGSDTRAVSNANPCGEPTPQTTVPDVVGSTEAAAETAIVGATLVPNTSGTAYSASVPAGSVVSQSPSGGSSVDEGSTVNIVISLGPPATSTVPNVVGSTEAAAISAITGANLVADTSAHAYSATVAAGNVISQSPAGGTTVDEGTTVSATISDGPAPSGDTVTVIKAEYKSDKSELKVEATSSDGGNVTLTLEGYGVMTYKADKNKYEYKEKPAANPGAGTVMTVTSSGGGQGTKTITIK